MRPDLVRGLEHFVPEILVRVAFEPELVGQLLPMLHDLAYIHTYIHSVISWKKQSLFMSTHCMYGLSDLT